jgi:two-component system response regulator YesN
MNIDPRNFRSIKQLQEWADTIHYSIVESKETKKTTSQENLVRKVHLYIEHHIADVSLQTLADHLSLHPAYVSAMYKQETSENLSDYILRYRMEKSGYMLRGTRLKIYEISEQLGYQHTPYFSKLFKNHYGVTPQDYRNHFN